MSAPTPAQLEAARSCIVKLRDALTAIALNVGTDMPPNALRSVAALGVRHADEVLAEIKP